MRSEREDKNIDFEIVFCEKILAENPDFLEALVAVGDLYTKKGLHTKAIEIDKRLARMRPEDPTVLYNLACSYSLLGNVDEAFQVMKLAIQSGYDDFGHLLRDKDLDLLLQDTRFRRYLEDLSRPKNP
ncbi:MAG: hypothetical protein Q8Q08_06410 [Candidatus Omnitrophota bacterium]|nr:hypothetical protein [Candidatus Omnitrophota bacterium]MDZ4243350.1 hypothetical protein [Candidatus Omnitrophota bacterium]